MCMTISLAAWRREAVEILKLQIPISLTIILFVTIRITAVVASGHLTVDEMSAVSLANSITNTFSTGTVLGICSASETFLAQSFGANKKMMGFFLQQTLLVVGGAMFLVLSLMINMEHILPILGQSQLISEMTSRYLLLLIPGAVFEALALILSHYLQAQNKVLIPTLAILLANVFNITSQVIALKVLHFGYLASAVCESASFLVSSLVLLSYILISGVYKDTWNGWTHESLYNMKRFMKLAIPGWLFVILEIGTFQIGVVVMGTVSEIQMSAQSIVHCIGVVCTVWSLGLSEAVTIRIGHKLGFGLPQEAKFCFMVSTLISIVLGTCLSILCPALRTNLSQTFTQDKDVQAAASKGLLYFALFPFLDFLATVFSGVLKGTGQQLLLFAVIVVGYVILAQPIGIPLSLLTDMQLGGIWVGYTIGMAVEILIYAVIIYRLNWEEQADLAKERCSQEADEVSSEEDSKTYMYLLAEKDDKAVVMNSRTRALVLFSLTYAILGVVLAVSLVYYLTKHV